MMFNRKEYNRKYFQSEQGKKAMKKHRQSEKGKLTIKKYFQSEKGKKNKAKGKGLNWILMFPNPFADKVKIDYHHINDAYVVAVPEELHFPDKRSIVHHREKVMEIVKQIYLDEYKF